MEHTPHFGPRGRSSSQHRRRQRPRFRSRHNFRNRLTLLPCGPEPLRSTTLARQDRKKLLQPQTTTHDIENFSHRCVRCKSR